MTADKLDAIVDLSRGDCVILAIRACGGNATSEQIRGYWPGVAVSITTVRRALRALIATGEVERVTFWLSRTSYTRLYRERRPR